MKIVAYHRVSTARQGQSGLGLAAQTSAIADYAASVGGEIIESFTEVESGTKNKRPELDRAIRTAKVTGAVLVIAKLDRLSRNAAFLLQLQEAKVHFVAADMPSANDLTVGVMALVAQEEARAIGRRTKVALQAAKARGTRLGNPNGAAALRRADKGCADSIAARQEKADEIARNLHEIVADLIAAGHTTLQSIADELNARGIQTPRKRPDARWHASSVRNLRQRIECLGLDKARQTDDHAPTG